MSKRLVLKALGMALVVVGCGESSPAPTGPPVAGGGDEPRSYEVRLSNVDDGAFLSINGQQIATLMFGDPEYRATIDRFLISGDNILEVVLGNGGCGASSLQLEILENGALVAQRDYSVPLSHCGYQLRWRYSINRGTGIQRLE